MTPRFLFVTPRFWDRPLRPWVSQWWLAFVLLWVDTALSDGCGTWEHLHSFREVKWGRGVSPTFHLLCNPSDGNLLSDLLRAITSYWKKSHLESRTLSNIHNGALLLKQKLHHRCSTRFQMHLWLESSCKDVV